MSDARWSALLFAAAFLARTVAWLGSPIFGTDSGHYLLMADWLREGRIHEALSVGYHPMYPLLIAVTRFVTGNTEVAGNLVSVVLGSAAALPLYRMVLAVFGRPAAALATLLYALHPAIVDVQSDVMTESTFMFFLFSAQWLTWRMTQEPTAPRAVVTGLAAAGAYLARPEGILALAFALAWSGVALIRSKERRGIRAAGLALTILAFGIAASPYLLWVKSERGHWALSPRQSIKSVETGLGFGQAESDDDEKVPPPSHYYGLFAKAAYRLTIYGIWIPFVLLGCRGLGGIASWFYLSLPLAHLAGILYTLRTHPFMSDRYIMAPVTLLGALAALGLLRTAAVIARKKPEAPWGTVLPAALMFAVAAVPAVRIFQPRRVDCLSYPVAASRILAENPHPRGMSGPVEQVAYLCGTRSYYSATTPKGLLQQIGSGRVEYYVYSEKDRQGRRDYIRALEACPLLSPPVKVVGPPGTLNVYYQRVK